MILPEAIKVMLSTHHGLCNVKWKNEISDVLLEGLRTLRYIWYMWLKTAIYIIEGYLRTEWLLKPEVPESGVMLESVGCEVCINRSFRK